MFRSPHSGLYKSIYILCTLLYTNTHTHTHTHTHRASFGLGVGEIITVWNLLCEVSATDGVCVCVCVSVCSWWGCECVWWVGVSVCVQLVAGGCECVCVCVCVQLGVCQTSQVLSNVTSGMLRMQTN